jgi:hypothetical protein
MVCVLFEGDCRDGFQTNSRPLSEQGWAECPRDHRSILRIDDSGVLCGNTKMFSIHVESRSAAHLVEFWGLNLGLQSGLDWLCRQHSDYETFPPAYRLTRSSAVPLTPASSIGQV